jgi:NADH-quinone oxidoreductase subunit L
MMLIITGIGFLIHLYSIGYMHHDAGFYKFFAYLNLFIFSMLLLVLGSNYIILFFGWEGVGLCSYLLIGFWYSNTEYGAAARKAFIMNRIGDLGLLLGIFLLFTHFGSADFSVVFDALRNGENLPAQGTISLIALLLFIGAMGKSAQLPLYTWLPDAMAGPTPVSALIHAATMVTAGIYLVVRSLPLYNLAPDVLHFIGYVGLATSIFAAFIGLRQNDIKKILAYSTVSQLGLMFVALGVGAYSAAMFHVTTHAFFKACLFLGAGSVIHAVSNEQDIRNMGGLRKHLPITFYTFLLATLAIIGFPFLSGFFSKDGILAAVYAHSKLMWAFTFVSAMLTAVYMTRLLWLVFFGDFRGSDHQRKHLHESPATMTIPLIVLAALSVVGGYLNVPSFMAHHKNTFDIWLSKYNTVPIVAHNISHSTEWILTIITTLLVLVVLVATYFIYQKPQNLPVSDDKQHGITKILANKFYVDELYNAVFVRPVVHLSNLFHQIIDTKLIDGAVNTVANISTKGGEILRQTQNGNVEYYLFAMVAGIIAILIMGIV